MKLGIVTPGFSADEGDWCIPILRDLVNELAIEHEVTVLALRYPHHAEPYRAFGARVIPLGGAATRGLRRVQLLRRAQARLMAEVEEHGIEIVHAFWAHEPGAVAGWVGRRAGVPVLVSLFGGELASLPEIGYGGRLSLSNRWLASFALRRAHRVTVGSAFQAALAERVCDPAKIVPLHLGADRRLFRETGPEAQLEGDPALVCVGSLVPVKGHEVVLRALVSLIEDFPRTVLHLFGEGPRRDELVESARRLGIDAHVQFHGEIPREQLPAVFRAARLHLLGSHFDATPMVVIEAMACGCPTVGTAVGQLQELGEAASTVPVGDHESFAAAIARALAPERRRAMVRAGLRQSREQLSLTHTVGKLNELYHVLLQT